MRYCSRCKCELNLSNSVYRDKEKLRQRSECKSCFSKLQSIQQQKRKQKLVNLKGGCCSLCNYNKCLDALDFHHIDPKEKEFSLSKIHSWNKTYKEIEKCILVCANCHREIHSKIYTFD